MVLRRTTAGAVKRRPLGRTGVSVSEIGFGCGPTAGLMVNGTPAEQRRVVGRALELGIDWFDTAPGYGDGASERNLGECLRAAGGEVMVATKVALTAADLDGDIAAAVERSVEGSLGRLGFEAVPVVQLHNRVGRERAPSAAFGTGALLAVDDVIGPGGVVDGFRRLRERGLAQFFGCSAFGGDMAAVERLVDSGAFDIVTVHYSLANPTAWSPDHEVSPDYRGIGARAAAAGMGVIGLRVLEGGRLAGEVGAALRFALANRDLSCVIVGFSDVDQVEQAAKVSYSL